MVLGSALNGNVLMLVTASPFPDHSWLFTWLAALSSLFPSGNNQLGLVERKSAWWSRSPGHLLVLVLGPACLFA